MFFRSEAEQAFDVDVIESPIMDTVIKKSAAVYSGEPMWKDAQNGIRTINLQKQLAPKTARLATLAIKITIEGSARAEWLQKQTDAVFSVSEMGGIWLCVWNGSHQAEREDTGCIHAG